MRCGVLGPLEVRGDRGALLDVPGAKERLLLALLAAASPRVVTVERLTEQLWDGQPPPSARKSLQAAVVRLRTALEPDRPRGSPGRFVVRRQRGYALVLDRDDLDATAFVDLVSRGKASLVTGDAGAAHGLLDEAMALWRGEPYADWPDALDLENERVRLHGVHDLATETLLEAELALGRHDEAVPELRRLCLEHPLRERWWELLALALYRAGSQGEALDALRRARSVLVDELGVDPGVRLRELEQKMLAQDSSLDLTPSTARSAPHHEPDAVTGCPWKGLTRYEVDDAAVFHGRTRLVATIVAALVDHSVVVLSGSSGAGKSSVARAGLLPALGAGALSRSEAWQQQVLTPGERPVDTLAPLTGDGPPTAPVVLVCDQLEQLWSPDVSPAERVAFLDAVLGLVADEVVLRVVLVVRGDHVGRLAEHPGMAERMLGGLVMVPPMTELELRQVVEEPASAACLTVESELTETAVRDVLGRAGALPLLSTALVQTWERRRDTTLTLAGYLASGGVAGAVARSAEQVHDSWTDEERVHARRILVRLAEQDDHGTVRARRLPLTELTALGADEDVTRRIVNGLLTARLLAAEDHHLEVAHEALLTSWPRLSAWLEEDSAGRAVRRHLAPDALEWEAHGRPSDELYRGSRLEAAAQWLAGPDSAATRLERDFVQAGLALAEAELRAARERADAEAAGHRRTRRFAGLLAVALVLALGAGAVAVDSQRRADDEASVAREARVVADANRLAALSSSARALDLSLLLAAAAVRTADTPATRDSLLDTLIEHRRATGVRRLDVHGIQETVLSTNGRTLVATVGGGVPLMLVWHPSRPEEPQVVEEWWPVGLAVSPDGRTLVGVGSIDGKGGVFAYSDTRQVLWSIPEARLRGFPFAVGFNAPGQVVVLSQRDSRRGDGYMGVLHRVDTETGATTRIGTLGRTTADDVYLMASFSSDGERLAVQSTDGRGAWLRDLSTGRVTPLRLADRDAASLEVVALPGGESAQMWSDGAVTRYDARGRAVQELDVHRAAVRDVHVLPGGRTGVTTGDDAQVVLWDIDRRGRWSFGESLAGHTGPVVQAETSRDGDSLLTASADGLMVTWDLTADAGLGSTYPGLQGMGRYVSHEMEVVKPGRLVVAPTRTLSKQPRNTEEAPGPDTLSVAAVFLDPRNGRVMDTVVIGKTFDSLFGSGVSASPDGRWVAARTNFETAILDAQSREIVARIEMPGSWPADFAWTPGGDLLIADSKARDDQGLEPLGRILSVQPGSWKVGQMARMPPPPRGSDEWTGTPETMEWSPDGQTLAVGLNYTHSLALFDQQLEPQQRIHLGDGGDVFDLEFSSDGRYLATGRGGGVLTVLDTRTWEPVHASVTMHAEFITDVEWLPDDNTVVTTGRDEMVSLYDVERDLVRGSGLPAAERPGDGYSYLLPGPDDRVVVVNEGGPGHVYPLDPARWLGLACTVAGRDLTRAEWDRYLPGHPYRPVCDLKRS